MEPKMIADAKSIVREEEKEVILTLQTINGDTESLILSKGMLELLKQQIDASLAAFEAHREAS